MTAAGSPLGNYAIGVRIVTGSISPTVPVSGTMSGYVHAPTVTFSPAPTGAYPIPACAVAYVNPATGQITSIVVTNVGSGYSTAPTASIQPSALDPSATGGTPAVSLSTTYSLGSMHFQYSLNALDPAPCWSDPLPTVAGASYSFTVPNVGVTLTFQSGTYTASQSYLLTVAAPIALSQATTDVSPRWWGAAGDGVTDDTLAIQAALSVPYPPVGRSVSLPAGKYVVNAPAGGVGLSIRQAVTLKGAGVASTTVLVNGPGTGLLIEDNPGTSIGEADNSIVRDMAFWGGFGVLPLDMIVVHAEFVTVDNVSINCAYESAAMRFGILIESGYPTYGGGFLGVTLANYWLSTGSPTWEIGADTWIVRALYGESCPSPLAAPPTETTASFVQPAVVPGSTGPSLSNTVQVTVASTENVPFYVVIGEYGNLYNVVSIDSPTVMTLMNIADSKFPYPAGSSVPVGTPVQTGALVMTRGNDSQAGVGTLINGVGCSITILENSLGGNTWNSCYSQDANAGYVAGSAGQSRFFGCGSEDVNSFALSRRHSSGEASSEDRAEQPPAL